MPIARQEKDMQGCQAEGINRRRKREGVGARKAEEAKDSRGQSPSYTASHRVRKERYIER